MHDEENPLIGWKSARLTAWTVARYREAERRREGRGERIALGGRPCELPVLKVHLFLCLIVGC